MGDVIRIAVRGLQFSADQAAKEVHKRTRDELKRMGAYVRGVARRSIGKGKVDSSGQRIPSQPGRTPVTWTGALKNSIVFGVENEGVVIGPGYGRFGKLGSTHEFGGTEGAKNGKGSDEGALLKMINDRGYGPMRYQNGKLYFSRIRSGRQARHALDVVRSVRADELRAENYMGKYLGSRSYPARPFMAPALRKIAGDLPIMLQRSVNNG